MATVSEDLEDTRMEDEGRDSDESGSEGDEGRAGCKYSDDGMGDSEDEMTDDESNDEDDGGWTADSEPESATARGTWDAAVRAGEVSEPEDRDKRGDSLYAVLLCNTFDPAGLNRVGEGHES